MELLKDIYFNTDKLVENTNVKVSYTGKFYQGNNDKVYIHYGYGNNWENVNEIEMTKTDLGYQADLNLVSNGTVNFCFKNQNNEWDNNKGQNYVFNVEKANSNEFGSTIVGTPEFGIVGDWGVDQPNTINSIDAIFGNNPENGSENSNVYFNTELGTNSTIEKAFGDCDNKNKNIFGNIIKPTSKLGSIIYDENSSFMNSTPVTALTTINTKLKNSIDWLKVKDSVINFFASVPKFITGNYKRIVGKHENNL